jgi:predicted DCC family thiol-disulfide oxidoreductase YuxK
MDNSDSILLFDGMCNLCTGVAHFILKIDKREKIRFATLQSSAAKLFLNRYGLFPDRADSVVYISGGKALVKSSAILHLLKDIGGGWKILYGFRIIPVFIRDFFYDLIAKSRYRIFGRRDSCMVPSEEIKWRFLAT